VRRDRRQGEAEVARRSADQGFEHVAELDLYAGIHRIQPHRDIRRGPMSEEINSTEEWMARGEGALRAPPGPRAAEVFTDREQARTLLGEFFRELLARPFTRVGRDSCKNQLRVT
jgi:hypothetical protein